MKKYLTHSLSVSGLVLFYGLGLLVCKLSGFALTSSLVTYFMLGCTGLTVIALLFVKYLRWPPSVLYLIAFIWGIMMMGKASISPPVYEANTIQGLVTTDVSHSTPERSAFNLRLLTCGHQPCKGQLRVFLKAAKDPVLGERVKLQGHFGLPADRQNFAGFSYAEYLKTQGTHAVFYANTLHSEHLAGGKYILLRYLQRVRFFVLSAFEAHLPRAQAHLLGSLIVGETASPVPDTLKVRFQTLGLQHVLAVSGFQVQLVVMTLIAVSARLRCGRRVQMLLAIVGLWLFVGLTGGPASVLRAAAVATWICLSRAWYKQQSTFDAFVMGIGGLLCWRPLLLFDVGFQFSAIATLGLIVMALPLAEKMNFLPLALSQSLGALLAAQLWVLPLQMFHFGTIAWLFLPGNLWAGFLSTLLTWFAIVGACLSPLQAVSSLTPCFSLFYGVTKVVITVLIKGMDGLLYVPHPVGYFPRLSPALLILAYGVLVSTVFIQQAPALNARILKRLQMLVVACLLTCLVLPFSQRVVAQTQCPLRVTYLSVGQGDAALVETSENTLLIDAGPRWQTAKGTEDAGQRYILPYLRQRGIQHLDYVLISHAHLDHYGGLGSLLREISVGEVLVPALQSTGEEPAQSYRELLAKIKEKGVTIRTAQNGSLLPLTAKIRLMFWQPLTTAHGHNDASLVLQLVHDQVRFLFAGDLEKEGETALLRQPGFVARTDILKVPHHGSPTSSTPIFLAAMQPQDAIVSVGERNRFRHPASEVLERYGRQGSRVWRTDQRGATCVCSQGVRYRIQSVR